MRHPIRLLLAVATTVLIAVFGFGYVNTPAIAPTGGGGTGVVMVKLYFDGGYFYDIAKDQIVVGDLDNPNGSQPFHPHRMQIKRLNGTTWTHATPVFDFTGKQLTLNPDNVPLLSGQVLAPMSTPLNDCEDEQILSEPGGSPVPSKIDNLYFLADVAEIMDGAAIRPAFRSRVVLSHGKLAIEKIGACVDYRNDKDEQVAPPRWQASGVMGISFTVQAAMTNLVLKFNGGEDVTVTPDSRGLIELRLSDDPNLTPGGPPSLQPGAPIEQFHSFYAAFDPVPLEKDRKIQRLVKSLFVSPGDLCPPLRRGDGS
jgi:hypothetical protein